jgi:hypothetical protein
VCVSAARQTTCLGHRDSVREDGVDDLARDGACTWAGGRYGSNLCVRGRIERWCVGTDGFVPEPGQRPVVVSSPVLVSSIFVSRIWKVLLRKSRMALRPTWKAGSCGGSERRGTSAPGERVEASTPLPTRPEDPGVGHDGIAAPRCTCHHACVEWSETNGEGKRPPLCETVGLFERAPPAEPPPALSADRATDAHLERFCVLALAHAFCDPCALPHAAAGSPIVLPDILAGGTCAIKKQKSSEKSRERVCERRLQQTEVKLPAVLAPLELQQRVPPPAKHNLLPGLARPSWRCTGP